MCVCVCVCVCVCCVVLCCVVCVCAGGGAVFSLGSSFFSFVSSDRKLAAIVFHSLKAREFLRGVEGEGTEAFLLNNAQIITHRLFNVCSSFHLTFHLLFRCIRKPVDFYVPRPSFGKCIHTQVY